jgi:dihydroneopterin aldolase
VNLLETVAQRIADDLLGRAPSNASRHGAQAAGAHPVPFDDVSVTMRRSARAP